MRRLDRSPSEAPHARSSNCMRSRRDDLVEFLGLRIHLHAQACEEASSTRSMALSGRKRSVMYRFDKVAAAVTSAAVGDANTVVQLIASRFKPRRIEMVSSTVGSIDEDGLKAASKRSVLLDVLAVFIERGCTDAVEFAAGKRGLQEVARHPSRLRTAPAPTMVCSSSMKRMTCGLPRTEPLTAPLFKRSSNSPRYFAPAIREPPCRVRARFLSFRLSGTSPLHDAQGKAFRRSPSCRRPVHRSGRDCSSCAARGPGSTRRISSSRPITGSSLPWPASAVRSRPNFSSDWYVDSGS